VQGKTIRCGTLHTPEVHAKPGKLIEIPVLIFLGKASGILPIVNLAGGPGQSWADLGLDQITATESQAFNEDVVFIEQRGTGLSSPRVDCPDQLEDEDDATYLQRCITGLTNAQINIAAYNTLELAGDVDTMAQVLKYKKITLSGVSYGTAWGEEVMRDYPGILAGVVLDSVLSPASPPLGSGASLEDGAFTSLFQACAADASCDSAYGDLQSKMLDDLSGLNTPLPITGTSETLAAGDFFSISETLLATDPTDLPLWIQQVHDGIAAGSLTINSSVQNSTSDESQATASDALGQYLSVTCSYNQQVTIAEATADTSKARAAFQPYVDNSQLVALCQLWPFQTFGASEFTPVTANVPTLLLSGDLDPLTPPPWAEEVATALPVATLVHVPGVGHDVSASGNTCVDTLIGSFYRSAGKEDASCASTIAVAFTLPNQTTARDIDFHGLLRVSRSTQLHDRIRRWRL
jgi:pimeloyl-ACP methyl ester carboxylesterase